MTVSRTLLVSPLVWAVIAGAVVRIALWIWFAPIGLSIFDERDYDRIARNLVQSGEFALVAGSPTSLRPPLYPAAVAALYGVFGIDNLQVVRLVQVVVSAITCWFIYRLGTRVFGQRVAALGACMTWLYPSLLIFPNLLLTETLFTCLLCAFCLLLVSALEHSGGSLRLVSAAGAILGLAALTRSVLWPFSVVLVPLLLIAWPGRFRRRVMAATLLVLTCVLVLLPWAVRNTVLERTLVTVDTMGGRNVMLGNYEYTPWYRMWDAISLEGDQNWFAVLRSEHALDELRTQGQIDQAAFRRGVAFAIANPLLTVERAVVKFFDFWGLEREIVAGAEYGYFGPITTSAILLLAMAITGAYTAAIVMGIFGVMLAPPADRRLHLFMLLLVGFVCALHVVTYGHSRYHLPLMPLVMLYAASAWQQRRNAWNRRWSRRSWLASCLCGTFAVAWLQIALADAARFWPQVQPG
jgi:4-amino-4-deoxy-L-arabinose transferase-like glycosyltransferase